MRVAYICADPGVPIFGTKGASNHVQEVTRALLKTGAKVELFAARLGGAPPADLVAVRVHELPHAGRGEVAAREQSCWRANAALRAALDSAGPFDLVYERYSLWSFAAIEYANASTTPSILEVNAPLIEEQAEHRGLVDRAGARRVAASVFAGATVVAAVSDGVADYVRNFPGADLRVHVVPNGVNADRLRPDVAPTAPAPAGILTIGFVGNLRPWHGVGVLLEAFERVHNEEETTRLLIVGGGDTAKPLGEAVQFTGPVQASEIPGLLASMDIGVAPYPRLDRFYFSPLKVYEYMAAGLAVVASRIGQIEQLIVSDKEGLLVTPGDPHALAAALLKLQRDPALRLRLGAAARAKILEGHTWDAVVERVLDLAGVHSASLTNR